MVARKVNRQAVLWDSRRAAGWVANLVERSVDSLESHWATKPVASSEIRKDSMMAVLSDVQ